MTLPRAGRGRLGRASIVLGLLIVVGSALGYALTAIPGGVPNPAGAPDDHFLCYGMKDQKSPKFVRIPGISLADQFGASRVAATKVTSLCAPANKNGEGIVDAATHLEGYAIKPEKGSSVPSGDSRTGLLIINQFGTIVVDAIKPGTLLVPSAVVPNAVSPPPALNRVDHYQCYTVKLAKKQKFSPISGVSVVDHFGSRTIDLKKPTRLCAPVDKKGEGIKNPTGYLLCYLAALTKTKPKQPKFVKAADLGVTNQFGSVRVTTTKVGELCVPSRKTVPGSPTPTPPTPAPASPTPTSGAASPTATPQSDPPTISDFNPKSASTSDQVIISGTNFIGSAGGPQVTMNAQGGGTMGAPIANFTATSITIVVPAGAATGPLTVTVGTQSATSASVLTIVPSSSFTLNALPPSATVMPGQSTSYSVSLASTDGFAQLAELSAVNVPTGLTASFNRSLLGDGQTALLTVTAPASHPLGPAMLTVKASATVDGIPVTQSQDVTLTVQRVTMSFAGRTVVQDPSQTPLAGVTVTFLGKAFNGAPTGCSGQTQSDAAGNFLLTNLPSECVGTQLIRYDGKTATSPPGTYAGVDLLYTFEPGQVTTPPVLIHLPRIDDAETVMVQQNAPADQVFTFATIPFLSVTVYAGTILTLVDGSQPNPFPLTAIAIPVDRLPDQMPPDAAIIMPFIVAFQPANADASQPVAVTFPNTLNTPPGVTMALNTLDPTKGTMVNYGTGTVSANGTQIIPNLDPAHPGHRYGLVHFDWHGQAAPPGPTINPAPPSNGSCPVGAKPIDPASGVEILSETDVAIAGLRGGLTIQRTYRTLSAEAGPFGIGTSHNFGYRLDTNAPQNGAIVNLIMPDGNRFPFVKEIAAMLRNTAIPALRGIDLSVATGGQAAVRFKDGTVYHFVPSTFLLGSVLESITDANGNRTTLVRDPSRPVRINQVIDPVGRKLRITYDEADRITSIADPIGRIVSYTYNAAGLLETVTNPAGGVSRYEYDPENRLSKVIDPRGITVARNSYYEGGALAGRAKEQILAGGGRWSFSYVLVNDLTPTSPVRETTVTDPLGNKTVYRYNPQGLLLDVTDPLGQKRVFEREEGTNLLLRITGSASCGSCGVSGHGDRSFTYDEAGNLQSSTDALGHRTSFAYEPMFNRVTSVIDPLGHRTSFTYDTRGNVSSITDGNGHTTSFAHDGTGNLIAISDPLGHDTRILYNSFANPVHIEDALRNVTEFAYDGVGRLTQITDALGRTTRFLYDALDQLTDVIDAQGNARVYSYDAVGELLAIEDARGHTTSFTYDPVTRESTRTDALGQTEYRRHNLAGSLVEFLDRRGLKTQFTYDALARLIRANYSDAMVEYTYDQLGRLAQVTDTQAGSFSHTYDVAGQLLDTAGPFGTITYLRDEAGRVKQRQVIGQSAVTYEYDPVGNLILAAMPEASVAMTYDTRNALLTDERSNGVTSTYSYDQLRRVLHILHMRGAVTIDDQVYSYNAVGRLTVRSGINAQPLATTSSVRSIDVQSDQVMRRDSVTYLYDANGNRTSESDLLGARTYAWDGRNRLRSIGERDGSSLTLVYDFAGNLISTRVGNSSRADVRTYVLDEVTNIVAQLRGTGDQIAVLNGRSIDRDLAVIDRKGAAMFGLKDSLGSTVAAVGSAPGPSAQLFYEPYGEQRSLGEDYLFRFTGREEIASGLYHYRGRYYDPTLGAFLSEDPQGIQGDGVSLYRYVDNDPVNRVDPLGLQSKPYDDHISWPSWVYDPNLNPYWPRSPLDYGYRELYPKISTKQNVQEVLNLVLPVLRLWCEHAGACFDFDPDNPRPFNRQWRKPPRPGLTPFDSGDPRNRPQVPPVQGPNDADVCP